MAAIAGRAWVLSSPKRRLIVPKHGAIRNRRFEISLSNRFPEGRRGRLRTAFDHGAERGAFSPVGRCRVDLVDKALLVAAREGLVSRRGGRPIGHQGRRSTGHQRGIDDRRFRLFQRQPVTLDLATDTPPFTSALRNRQGGSAREQDRGIAALRPRRRIATNDPRSIRPSILPGTAADPIRAHASRKNRAIRTHPAKPAKTRPHSAARKNHASQSCRGLRLYHH